jgi:hypothetical protein
MKIEPGWTRATVNLTDMDAEIVAARSRTGRTPEVIYADWIATSWHMFDLIEAWKATKERGRVDGERSIAAVNGIAASAKPQALKVAGLVIKRHDPEAEARRIHDGFMARQAARTAQLDKYDVLIKAADNLVSEFVAEIGRAGIPADEARIEMRALALKAKRLQPGSGSDK